MKPVQLALYILLMLSGCQFNPHQSAESNNVVDTIPILNIIRYDRDGAELRYWMHPQALNEIIHRRDSIAVPELGLMAYLFQWGGETGGPRKRILCFRRPEDQFQREFYYEGEYSMSRMNYGKELESGERHSLGLQLSQLALEMGPQVYTDSLKMEKLLVSTFEELLKCPSIQPSTLDSIIQGSLNYAHFYNYYPWVKLSKPCLKTLENIHQEMTSGKKTAYYFQGDLYNGIWKAQLVQEEKNKYYINLDYLNGECAFTIWF